MPSSNVPPENFDQKRHDIRPMYAKFDLGPQPTYNVEVSILFIIQAMAKADALHSPKKLIPHIVLAFHVKKRR
jgi:hypothetical protein